ncbi:hypothetical protein N0V84_012779, partial [Fusarium piperis]
TYSARLPACYPHRCCHIARIDGHLNRHDATAVTSDLQGQTRPHGCDCLCCIGLCRLRMGPRSCAPHDSLPRQPGQGGFGSFVDGLRYGRALHFRLYQRSSKTVVQLLRAKRPLDRGRHAIASYYLIPCHAESWSSWQAYVLRFRRV